jgi:hypothetical protein
MWWVSIPRWKRRADRPAEPLTCTSLGARQSRRVCCGGVCPGKSAHAHVHGRSGGPSLAGYLAAFVRVRVRFFGEKYGRTEEPLSEPDHIDSFNAPPDVPSLLCVYEIETCNQFCSGLVVA